MFAHARMADNDMLLKILLTSWLLLKTSWLFISCCSRVQFLQFTTTKSQHHYNNSYEHTHTLSVNWLWVKEMQEPDGFDPVWSCLCRVSEYSQSPGPVWSWPCSPPLATGAGPARWNEIQLYTVATLYVHTRVILTFCTMYNSFVSVGRIVQLMTIHEIELLVLWW